MKKNNLTIPLIIVFALATTFFACDGYAKVLKSTDRELKLEKAKEYYNTGDYYKAIPLFEELIAVYRDTSFIDTIYYFYCYSFYGQREYIRAAYNFKNLVSSFPFSSYTQEAQFMYAKCYHELVPNHELDQQSAQKAIDAYQLFINKFPKSKKVAKANAAIDSLRRTITYKSYQGAKLYYEMQQYKSASNAFTYLLEDYPAIEEAEEVHFLIVKSNYLYAKGSQKKLQRERYEQVIQSHDIFAERFPKSKLLKQSEEYKNLALNAIKPAQ